MVIKNIQALRAIAANGVLVSHLFIVEQKYSHGGEVLSAHAHLGAFGVDLFFVISGFIMATIARNASWHKFLFDRAMRILPPYWFYTTLILIVSFYVPAYVNSSFEHPPSISRSYLLIPDRVGPLLGEDNHYVFTQILGLDDSELARLEKAGVIGTRPAGQ